MLELPPAACSARQASPGFIELWSLQSRLAHRLRAGEADPAEPVTGEA